MDIPQTTTSGGARTHLAEALARAGWLRVLDDILGGLSHDLNGRVSSLEGLTILLEMDGPSQATSLLRGEAGRLAEVVRVLRDLLGDVGGDPVPLMPAEAATRAESLYRRHRGLDSMPTRVIVAEGLPPFRANPFRVNCILLILLSRAGIAAGDGGVNELRLDAVRVGDEVCFDVAWLGDQRLAWDAGDLSALQEVAAADGGRIDLTDRGGVRLIMPAMTKPGA